MENKIDPFDPIAAWRIQVEINRVHDEMHRQAYERDNKLLWLLLAGSLLSGLSFIGNLIILLQ